MTTATLFVKGWQRVWSGWKWGRVEVGSIAIEDQTWVTSPNQKRHPAKDRSPQRIHTVGCCPGWSRQEANRTLTTNVMDFSVISSTI